MIGKRVFGLACTRQRVALALATALAALAGCSDDTDPSGTGGNGAGTPAGTGASGSGNQGAGAGSSAGAPCSISKGDIAVASGPGTSPAVAFGGDRFAVVWTDNTGAAGDIALTLVTTAGEVVATHAIATGAATSLLPSVVALPAGGYLVLWQDGSASGSKVLGRRTAPDGTPSAPAFEIASSNGMQSRPAGAVLSANGVAVTWMDAATAYVGDLQQDMILQKSPIDGGGYPAITASGSTVALTWAAGAKIGFAKVTSPLGPIAPTFFRNAPGRANVPRITPTEGGSYLVAWEDTRDGDGNEQVYFSRVQPDGKAEGEIAVPEEAGSANYPDIAWTGKNVVVAYYQYREGPPSVFVSTFGADLSRDSDELLISGEAAARYPRIAWGGGKLAIVYAENAGPLKMALLECK